MNHNNCFGSVWTAVKWAADLAVLALSQVSWVKNLFAIRPLSTIRSHPFSVFGSADRIGRCKVCQIFIQGVLEKLCFFVYYLTIIEGSSDFLKIKDKPCTIILTCMVRMAQALFIVQLLGMTRTRQSAVVYWICSKLWQRDHVVLTLHHRFTWPGMAGTVNPGR